MKLRDFNNVIKEISGKCFFDYIRAYIIKEEDMRTSFYYHFRKWIEKYKLETEIQIYVNKTININGKIKYPDLVIYTNIGNIYIELKCEGNIENRIKKDIETLLKIKDYDEKFLKGWLIDFRINKNKRVSNLPERIEQIAYPLEKYRKELKKLTNIKYDWTPRDIFFKSKKYWISGVKAATFNLMDNPKLNINYLSQLRKIIGKNIRKKEIYKIMNLANCTEYKAERILDYLEDYENALEHLEWMYIKNGNY